MEENKRFCELPIKWQPGVVNPDTQVWDRLKSGGVAYLEVNHFLSLRAAPCVSYVEYSIHV